jgi:hypothetical protein
MAWRELSLRWLREIAGVGDGRCDDTFSAGRGISRALGFGGTRRVEFELRVPEAAATGSVSIPAYALYYVCEDVDGTCVYRRQDFTIEARIRRRQ